MDGIVFVAILSLGVTFAGLRSRRSLAQPGVFLTLALAAASTWYVLG